MTDGEPAADGLPAAIVHASPVAPGDRLRLRRRSGSAARGSAGLRGQRDDELSAMTRPGARGADAAAGVQLHQAADEREA